MTVNFMNPTCFVPMFGGDIELFIQKNRSIKCSSDIIPTNGIETFDMSGHKGKIICDGLQVEFNLFPASCRAYITNNIKALFDTLKSECDKNGYSINTKGSIRIPKKTFEKLGEDAKKFGCDPSYNAHSKEQSLITVNPAVYRIRTAGGHIHMSDAHTKNLEAYSTQLASYKVFRTHLYELVQLCDIIIGNTCVLIDRDPNQIERRKVYGRAGEYREKPYGIEYRTLSNFWIMHSGLSSFVLGLAKFTLYYAQYAISNYGSIENSPIMKAVKIEEVVEAINNNNYNLAKKNFLNIEKYFTDLCGTDTSQLPFGGPYKMLFFKWLCITKCSEIMPYSYSPINHWQKEGEGHRAGIDTYAARYFKSIPNDINDLFIAYEEKK